MAEVTAEQSKAIAEELPKVGQTIAKVAMGIVAFIEKMGGVLSPILEGILVRVLTGLAENWGNKVLKKNGVDV